MRTDVQALLFRWLWPALVALLIVGLGACASSQPIVWDKPGVSDAMIQRDQYECERDMRMGAASFGGGIVAQGRAEQFFQRCMVAKGYHRLQ